jgi:hypothetical protein
MQAPSITLEAGTSRRPVEMTQAEIRTELESVENELRTYDTKMGHKPALTLVGRRQALMRALRRRGGGTVKFKPQGKRRSF